MFIIIWGWVCDDMSYIAMDKLSALLFTYTLQILFTIRSSTLTLFIICWLSRRMYPSCITLKKRTWHVPALSEKWNSHIHFNQQFKVSEHTTELNSLVCCLCCTCSNSTSAVMYVCTRMWYAYAYKLTVTGFIVQLEHRLHLSSSKVLYRTRHRRLNTWSFVKL